jgi:hypothetical protein
VIALVTQFDDPAAMPSGATPSGASSSSSCCCCCVVTAVGTSIVSGKMVRSTRLEEAGEPPETASAAHRIRAAWPEILAGFALPLAIGLVILGYAAGLTGAQPILLGALLWWLVLAVPSRYARDEHWILHPIITILVVPSSACSRASSGCRF